MDNEEMAKLMTLLNYWTKHNKEHGQEFKEWSDKIKVSGEAEASEDLLQAAQEMDKASECLLRALKRLELIIQKRRLGMGNEVILNIRKAQEKIKIFR